MDFDKRRLLHSVRPDEFAEFYRRLKQLKDYHRRYPSDVEEPMQMEFLKLDKESENPLEELQNMVDFTDEEGYGKYLDLHQCYDYFINLKQLEFLGSKSCVRVVE